MRPVAFLLFVLLAVLAVHEHSTPVVTPLLPVVRGFDHSGLMTASLTPIRAHAVTTYSF